MQRAVWFLLLCLALASGGVGLVESLRLRAVNHWAAYGDGFLFWKAWSSDPGRGRLLAAAGLAVGLIALASWARRGGPGLLSPVRRLVDLLGRWWLAAAAVLLAALPYGVWLGLGPDPSGRPSCIFVLLDSVRLDFTGPGREALGRGLEVDATPGLDALAAEGAAFTQAISQAPWTKPSVASLLTGRIPSHHQAVGRPQMDWFPDLPPRERTLAEAFAQAGYATTAISTNRNVSRSLGFKQGFRNFHSDYRTVEEVVARARRWLEGREQPFFLYLHLNDAHYPYEAPAPFRGLFDKTGSDWRLDGENERRFRSEEVDVGPEVLEHLQLAQAEEIRYVDHHLVPFLREQLTAREDLVVVVVSDHGDEFLDHGDLGHGHQVYDELIRVPLQVAWSPALGAKVAGLHPQVVGAQVRLVDLAPTLLELAGLEWPAAAPALDGESLMPLLRGEATGDRPAFSETDAIGSRRSGPPGPLRAWREPGAKLIRSAPLEGVELKARWWHFDLAADPLETRNLAGAELPDFQRLLRALETSGYLVLKPAPPPSTRDLRVEPGSEMAELGYAGDLGIESLLEKPVFLRKTVPWVERED